MKVLHTFRTYFPDPPGGIQEAIKQMCLATSLNGVTNSVYALSPKPNPNRVQRPEGVVFREKSWLAPASCDIGGFSSINTFRYHVFNTDLLHYHFPWPFADVLHSLLSKKPPSIITYHSDIVRQKLLGFAYSPLMWSMLRSMDIIVATSPNYVVTSKVLSHPEIRNKVRVIPLGIDEKSYPLFGDDLIFEKLSLLSNEPYFLFIGVPRYYKGVHSLIRAASLVNAKLVIAGSGGELEFLKNLVTELKLNNVIFSGFVTDSEKVSLIKRCVALVLPSHLRSEAFGMVLVEAAMFSRPMISCEIGTGTTYVNIHEETGFVVSPEMPAELARAMNSLLRDEQMGKKLGLKARLRYEQLFSGIALGEAYSDLYKELM